MMRATSTTQLKPLRLVGAALLHVLAATYAHGGTFTESLAQELSNDASRPTVLQFLDSTNRVNGVVGDQDLIDHWSFEVRPGQQLDEITLSSIFTEEPGGRTDAVFFYVDDGRSTTPPSPENAADWLGGFHLTDRIAPPSENILLLNPVTGGDPIQRLGPGVYTVGLQQNGPYSTHYSLTFEISGTPVPEPGTFGLLLCIAGLDANRRRTQAMKPSGVV